MNKENKDRAKSSEIRPTDGLPAAGEVRDAELAALCKALSHPVRVAILRRLLAIGGCVCGEIVEVMPLAQSTVSQHLKILKESGLVKGEVDGPRVCYCADPAVLARFYELAGTLAAPVVSTRPLEDA